MMPEMSLAVETTETIPLAADANGVVRVAGTRVTLDSVAEAFEEGATAEEIAQQYPSVSLAAIYSVIAYILRHHSEVADYLAQRAEENSTVQKANERHFSPEGLRGRLMARRSAAEHNGK
jgi:uncharacterized protein (DUF433 family)